MSRPLTLMAVHAHPDDEATSTGGTLAKYAAEGIRTVLVTCTDGALGDSGGVKPGEDGHAGEELVALRAAELAASCEVLGITHAHLLGYADSGMMGWPQNDAAGSFWSTPVAESAAQLAALIREYQPDVVVTYDAQGFYGHPDHIQAHRITVEALNLTESPAKLYFSTMRRSLITLFAERMKEAGEAFPDFPEEAALTFGSLEEDIAADIDCADYAQHKFDSLAAHQSQAENIFFLKLAMPAFTELMGREVFLRERPVRTDSTVENDLFAGLR